MTSLSITSLRFAGALAAAMALAACGRASAPSIADPPSLGGEHSGASTSSPDAALLGSWRADGLDLPGEPPVTLEPDLFAAEFHADGTLALRADCNRCAAGFSAATGSLEVGPMACTRAACLSSPRDTQFAGLVGSATSWSVDGDRLELRSPSGAVHLRR